VGDDTEIYPGPPSGPSPTWVEWSPHDPIRLRDNIEAIGPEVVVDGQRETDAPLA
jgi:hypothetical protein